MITELHSHLCIFRENPDFVTCFTPAQMAKLGILGGDINVYNILCLANPIFKYSEMAKHDCWPINYSTKVSINIKLLDKCKEFFSPKPRSFFEFYCNYYYKKDTLDPNDVKIWIEKWKAFLREIWVEYQKASIPGNVDYLRQIMLEIAWDYRRNPTLLI